MESNIVQWTNTIGIIIAAFITLSIWGAFIYFGFRRRDFKEIMRSMTVLVVFFVWFTIITIQNWLSSQFSILDLYSVTFMVGYFIFPMSLIALWRVVLLHVGKHFHFILKIRRYRLIMISMAAIYGLFYLFASGMLSLVNLRTSILPDYGYIETSQSYGPLSIWPNIEFWWPTFNLFGIISIAGVLMVFTLAGLIGLGLGFVIYQWRLKRKMDMKTMGSTVGSSIAVTATCFVGCAAPVIYPLLILLFGSATAEPLSRMLANESGLLVNLVQMAVLSLMVASVVYAAHRLNGIETRAKKELESIDMI